MRALSLDVQASLTWRRRGSDWKYLRDEMRALLAAWRPAAWPEWPDSALNIHGTLTAFEVIERVLTTSTGSASAEVDPLEAAWSWSTLELV